jgi:hypothetical protein
MNELLKCKSCGGDPELEYMACIELGSSGMFQGGYIQCQGNGSTKHCLMSVNITFNADYPPKDINQQLINIWNELNK